MPLEILERAKPGGKYHAPTFRVRCSLCSSVYLVTATLAQVRRTRGCATCGRARVLASKQADKSPSDTEPHGKGDTWDGSHPPPVGAPEVCGCDESIRLRALLVEAAEVLDGWMMREEREPVRQRILAVLKGDR